MNDRPVISFILFYDVVLYCMRRLAEILCFDYIIRLCDVMADMDQ